jgi:hypothetical protein
MATRDSHDDVELDASVSKVESLYQELPKEEFSKEVEGKIMKVAREHASSRRAAQPNWWIQFIRRPVVAVAGAILVISAIMYGVQRPAFVGKIDPPDFQQLFEDDGPITRLAGKIDSVNKMVPASKKWNDEVDKLMKEAGNKVLDYESMVVPLEEKGKTADAEALRKLTGDLRQLFEQRDPNWINKITDPN